ncbi:restriction endonuclease subunit S [Proteus mirabilis]|uniref:restriction endonuclease subunit S n=1 Tax=Proteus mirabilis TaxID=584 RepID=UPI00218211E5|nr:restriction endonuclease subunit S [Proteus mirabilis]ELN4246077.1 restriction endonuclease subunit S [Proteus mirabilis]ELN4569750.1 restriction endonuclease subunit S [Proteus mirabilis]MCT0081005.1 restriction endonuclease subunit S [Proteus mirabilis]
MGSNSWREVKLSDLGEVARGRSRHRPRYAEHLYGGEYPFIQTGDIKASEGRISSHEQTYSEAGLAQSRLWPAGTMCITIAANIAETGVLQYPACFPDSVIGFIADKNKADVYYIEYVFRKLRKDIQRQATGSVQDNINLQTFERLKFKVPHVEEQHRIANFLNHFDKKITLNRQINQTLEQMAQTLFKSWFVDFDPVVDNALDAGFFEQDLGFSEELLHRVEVRKTVRKSDNFKPLSENIRRLFPNAFEECAEPSLGLGGWIPKGWTISALDKIANFQNGLALQKFRPDSENDEYLPVLKIAQLRQGYCDANEKAKIDIIESCRVYNGDMIFSWSGTLMIDIWTGGDAALNQHLFKVTSKNYPLSFYYHWTNHHLARFQHIAAAKAVTMGHIKKGDLSSSYCVVPTTQVLSYFDSITGSYLEQAKSVRLQCNTLTNLRDTLLPKLISGELSLNDVKINIPEETLI